MDDPSRPSFHPLRILAAWGVHLFTAGGLLAGFMALLAVADRDWRTAIGWLLLAQFIDGIDGTFARMVRVWEVLPNFSGKTLDYVIDFATYAIIPAYFFFESDLTTGAGTWIGTFAILLSSALYYGKEGMVADEQYFVGFPVLWNWVVFYLILVFDLAPAWNLILVILFAVLHFVPIKFAYPSRARRFKWLTLGFSALTIIAILVLLWHYPQPALFWRWAAVAGGAYFGIMGILTTWFAGSKS
ncbi:MAG: hypothetical protein H6562_24195 [Lewinellaceae bacterium]|nr:hypothetical protein [Lewinella sp.]MCB9282012.1 hypothetical protein [Lewinellaceae bacterium]